MHYEKLETKKSGGFVAKLKVDEYITLTLDGVIVKIIYGGNQGRQAFIVVQGPKTVKIDRSNSKDRDPPNDEL